MTRHVSVSTAVASCPDCKVHVQPGAEQLISSVSVNLCPAHGNDP